MNLIEMAINIAAAMGLAAGVGWSMVQFDSYRVRLPRTENLSQLDRRGSR
jgi:hypothetical protein